VPDQPDQRRAAIQAVRGILVERDLALGVATTKDAYDQAAAELVDAVHAAGRDGQGEAAVPTLLDIADLASKAARAQQEVARAIRHQAHAEGETRGWRQAVQALRDDQRYGTWWYATHSVESHLGPPVAARLHAADYLEAVGPGTARAAVDASDGPGVDDTTNPPRSGASGAGKPLTRPTHDGAETVPDGGDGAGVGERSGEGGTGGSGTEGARGDLIRQHFERAAELTEERTDYGDRWARAHEQIAEAAVDES
jgi:hypothetical protein